ncbi:MAG: glycosyltransferase family 2 protein, partial [Desulfovibrio sp.]|nr:glycosyltransferase family 2 protein [Desulfovibrio sp.]
MEEAHSQPGADRLAMQTISAFRQGRMDEALFFAASFASQYGKTNPEAYALFAHVLEQTSFHETALDAWDEAICFTPSNLDWVERAFKTAWSIKKQDCIDRSLSLIRNTFLSSPKPSFLEELETLGIRISGSCGIHAGHLRGWVWCRNDTSFAIRTDKNGCDLPIRTRKKVVCKNATLYDWTIPLPSSTTPYTISVTVDDTDVTGSPATVFPSFAARPKMVTKNGFLTILMPCYRGRKSTLASIASVLASRKCNRKPFRLCAIWDHGPDKELFDDLVRLAKKKTISLLQTPRNMGFLGTINFALSQQEGGDVILLNSDTLVHGNWVDRMLDVASLSDAGTVTAMGSDAELLSYPSPSKRGSVSTLRETAILDRACASLPLDMRVREIPVGVGFCMLITQRALCALHGFDGLTLSRGYGEEVEFCLRCKQLHLKNYAACHVYVAHLCGTSFGSAKQALAWQNNDFIFDAYPFYKQQYADYLLEAPLIPIRDRIARTACKAMGGELHIYSWPDQF